MVHRLHVDMTALEPSPAQHVRLVASLASGEQTPGEVVAGLRDSTDHRESVDPVTRLYRAFYLRIPDKAGLEFWIARRRTGAWKLVRIADHFAGSSEFARRYGSLSNRGFVELIYRNVLERPSDSAGLSYWTRQLDQRRRTRGAVMANFSESNEYQRKQAAEVHVSVLSIMLLGRSPGSSEFAAGVTALEDGQSVAAFANQILNSPAYATRVGALVEVDTSTLPGATTSWTYAVVLEASGGTGPYRWSASGLPRGLAITPDGLLWGRPAARGASSVVVRAADRTGVTTSTVLTLAVTDPSPLTGAVALAGGDAHTCAIVAGGTVRCWGANESGQLGDGTAGNLRLTPVEVQGVTGATAISAGYDHTCAIVTGGAVRCWGGNQVGQLGDGTVKPWSAPVTVSGIAGARGIAAGHDHTCALTAEGTVLCWGDNNWKKLGNESIGQTLTPTPVAGIADAVAITANRWHSCARLSDGSAMCWGGNFSGELGDGRWSTWRATPVQVVGLTGASEVVAGGRHTCAVVPAGTMACWGNNDHAQLGDGTQTARQVPRSVSGVTQAAGIAAGRQHSCARLLDGTVRCWGTNEFLQVGDGTAERRLTSARVSGVSGATSIAAGSYHTCAIVAGGQVRCWGDNEFGALGDGTTQIRTSAVVVTSGYPGYLVFDPDEEPEPRPFIEVF